MNSPRLLVACATLCVACSNAFGGITYQVVPREGTEAPWGLVGGSITTDGTIGEIGPENFESWEMDISSPAGESEIVSTNGGAYLIVETFTLVESPVLPESPPSDPPFVATASQLILNPDMLSLIDLFFASQDIFSDDFTGNVVGYSPSFPVSNHSNGGGVIIDNAVDGSDPVDLFSINPAHITEPRANPNRAGFSAPAGPLVIAAVVPEPSSSLIFVTCFLSLIFHRRLPLLSPSSSCRRSDWQFF